MLLLQVQDGDVLLDLERRVGKVFAPDLIAVPGIESADPGGDTGSADDFAPLRVLQDKQIVFGAGLADLRTEGGQGVLNPRCEERLIRWQRGQPAAGGMRQGDETGQVGFANGAEEVHRLTCVALRGSAGTSVLPM